MKGVRRGVAFASVCALGVGVLAARALVLHQPVGSGA